MCSDLWITPAWLIVFGKCKASTGPNHITENTKIEPFDKGGVTGYFFQKDGMSYICFERDGCFFSVYGSIDTDELVKIAASITKK